MKNNKKGFTLIELIVIIAVLGILVLLAAPKFIGYIERAKLVQIQNDSKAHESFIEAKTVENQNYYKNWPQISVEELKKEIEAGALYNKTGLLNKQSEISENILYYEIPKKLINTKLKGKFIYSEGGTVYYNGKGSKNNVVNNDSDKNFRWVKDTRIGMKGDSPLIFALADIAPAWGEVGDYESGHWHYIGDEEVVVIPDTIQGYHVTSYRSMFQSHWDWESQTLPKKIISTNKDVTDMSYMFSGFGYEDEEEDILYIDAFDYTEVEKYLDLTEFDTSGVENMTGMFEYSGLRFLDLTNFDTSNVKDMSQMFAESAFNIVNIKKFKQLMNLDKNDITEEQFDEVYRINFDTSNVEDMSYMFEGMHIKKAYLEGFNTSNVYDMDSMFKNAQISDGISFKNFDTSNVYDMNMMFYRAEINDDKLDLSNFDTSNVGKMKHMFYEMNGGYDYSNDNELSFGHLYLNKFNVDGVSTSNIKDMFYRAKVENVYIDDSDTMQKIKSNGGNGYSTITFH